MTKQRIRAVAATVFATLLAGTASAVPSSAASPSPAPTTRATIQPTPAPTYDPGPRPVSIVSLCAVNLKLNPPLYQQPNAPLAIAPNEIGQVTTTLESQGTPLFVSILVGPGERAKGLSREIQDRMRTPGTFLTIMGTVYDAFSTEFDAQPLLAQAFAEQRHNGTAAVVDRFAVLSGQAAQGPLPTPDFIAWRPTIIVFVVVFGVGIIVLLTGWRRRDDSPADPQPPAGAVDLPESS